MLKACVRVAGTHGDVPNRHTGVLGSTHGFVKARGRDGEKEKSKDRKNLSKNKNLKENDSAFVPEIHREKPLDPAH